MASYKSSITIDAESDAVWRVLSEVGAWPEWLPTVSKVESLDQNSLRLGARFVVHQPKLRPTTWTVSELEPPRRFVWVARSPGLEMIAEHAITQEPEGSTRVDLRFSFAGLLGGVVGMLFRSVTQNYLVQEAASLKRKVEASR